MGNSCSCIKPQTPKANGRANECNVVPLMNGTASQTDSTVQRQHVAGNIPYLPSAQPPPQSRQYVVVNRSNANALMQRHRAHDIAASRGTVMVVTTQRSQDLKSLVLDTLRLIRSLTANDDQDPPWSLVQLHRIAEEEHGWVRVFSTLLTVIPIDDPLGPAAITLLLDDCSLPTKEAVDSLFECLQFSTNGDRNNIQKHRNICIALGCLAEKMAGPSSIWLLTDEVLDYLISNLDWRCDTSVILFSIIALEKFAQTSENQLKILSSLSRNKRFDALEQECQNEIDFCKREVGFCAQWCLDNLFVLEVRVSKNEDLKIYSQVVSAIMHRKSSRVDVFDRKYTYETIKMSNINAMLNSHDVSEYLKLSPNGLEARCDASSFESVRCTYQVGNSGVWYYEVLIITSGIMQIGWATKDSRFLNYEGYGIGDDENSIAYDGCRQLIWFNANSRKHNHPCWKPGDILGLLLDIDNRQAVFSLNGQCLPPNTDVFDHTDGGYFAAASFMSFQQCCFNFGAEKFRYPPKCNFNNFNDFGSLSEDDKIILPRKIKLARLREVHVLENSCTVCADNVACVVLHPCQHSGFCMECSMQLELCPLCRTPITLRQRLSSTSS